ncbi:MAG: holo-[acyl-carrier-protein] synthase [Alphaproteobacteria bacterium]|nr:holo-[acyl-carrier-protein] synthase [Alphaproteobacteria bacterium]|tara:strand:- start:1334 stop:1747 length:414 start_codon:yes stop_codon:yes gene_type:complete
MIIGIGHDIVDIRRIEKAIAKYPEKFMAKYFSKEESELASSRDNIGQMAATLAKRFAAKEAAAKALGTGFREGLYLKDICVTSDSDGRPELVFFNKAQDILKRLTPVGEKSKIFLSLSDEPPFASAYVIIESLPMGG